MEKSGTKKKETVEDVLEECQTLVDEDLAEELLADESDAMLDDDESAIRHYEKLQSQMAAKRTEAALARTKLNKERSDQSAKRTDLARARVELANVRTFLAWCRTALAFMGFGFVLEKIIYYFLGLQDPTKIVKVTNIGVLSLLTFGAGFCILVFAAIRFIRIGRDVGADPVYKPIPEIIFLAIAFVSVIGLFFFFDFEVHV